MLFSVRLSIFPSVLWHCWLGDSKGIWPSNSWVLVCWLWHFDWSFACLIALVVTTTSIILSSNKIQNGDILVLANWGPPGKMAIKTDRAKGCLLPLKDLSQQQSLFILRSMTHFSPNCRIAPANQLSVSVWFFGFFWSNVICKAYSHHTAIIHSSQCHTAVHTLL